MTTTPRIPKSVFWRVAATSGLGELSQGVADVALPLIAVGALGATGWQASAVTAAESAGLVLFGLFAGVVADRHNRVSVITTANGERGETPSQRPPSSGSRRLLQILSARPWGAISVVE